MKTGDKAKVIGDSGPRHHFDLGVIVELKGNSWRDGVVLVSGPSPSHGDLILEQRVNMRDLEMVGGEDISKTHDFKIGDRAKVLKKGISAFSPGDVVEVMHPKTNPYCRRLSDDLYQHIQEHHLVKLEEGGKEDMSETSLKDGDKVNFTFRGKEYKGRVSSSSGCYFVSFDDMPNSKIFHDLGLDEDDFCEEHYTLSPSGGDWPEAQTLEDLERVISALRDEIHRQETKHKEEKSMSKSLTIDDIEVGDHIEILEGFNHPAMKPGAIVECVEIRTDKAKDHQIRTTFVKGTPHAGKDRSTHPFPYTSRNRENGYFRIIKNKEDGMRSKDILIDFMMGKQSKLGSDVEVVNVRDMRSIEGWSDRDADKVLEKMKEVIESDTALSSPRACPFCFYHDWFNTIGETACKECDYAQVHDKCASPDSDYRDADRITRKHDLEVGDLMKKLQKEDPAPQTLKMWANRSEDDHPKQVYICFDDKSGDIHFYACDKDGSPIDGGNLFHFDKNGGHITLHAYISRDVPGIDRDPAGQIKIE